MNTTLPAPTLHAALRKIAGMVPRKTNLEATQHVRLHAQGDELHLSLTGLEVSYSATLSATTKAEGSALIPHAALTSALASIKGDVTIDASEQAHVRIKTTRTRARIPLLPTDARLDAIDATYSAPVTLSAPLLADMITRVLPFISKSGGWISITGALVRVEGDQMTISATDSYRMARVSAPIEYSGEKIELILAREHAEQLIKLLPDDGSVTLEHGSGVLRASFGDTFTCLLLDGGYPNLDNLIATYKLPGTRWPREELLGALQYVASFAPVATSAAFIEVKGDSATVSASDSDTGEASVVLTIEESQRDARAAFNVQYLGDALKVMESPEVAFSFGDGDGLAPGVLTETCPGALESIYIVMPTRVVK